MKAIHQPMEHVTKIFMIFGLRMMLQRLADVQGFSVSVLMVMKHRVMIRS